MTLRIALDKEQEDSYSYEVEVASETIKASDNEAILRLNSSKGQWLKDKIIIDRDSDIFRIDKLVRKGVV